MSGLVARQPTPGLPARIMFQSRCSNIKEHRLLGSVGETLKFTGAARWLDDGTSLAFGGKVWKVDSGKLLQSYTAGDGYKVSAQAWSPDGSMWVSFRGDKDSGGLLEVRDFKSDKVRLSVRQHPSFNYLAHSWSLSPEGKTVALVDTKGKTWLWDVHAVTQPSSLTLSDTGGLISWFPDNQPPQRDGRDRPGGA